MHFNHLELHLMWNSHKTSFSSCYYYITEAMGLVLGLLKEGTLPSYRLAPGRKRVTLLQEPKARARTKEKLQLFAGWLVCLFVGWEGGMVT